MSEEVFAREFRRYLEKSARDLLMTEVDTGEGVPDLVALRVSGMAKHELAEVLAGLPAEPFLNGTGALLAELNHRPHTADYLSERTGLSVNYIRRAIGLLCQIGWAQKTSRGLFMAVPERPFPDIVVTAYECKMKDARRAVQQAIRYRHFAHRAVVVLPKERKASIVGISELACAANLGVGLFDTSTGTLRLVMRPRKLPPRSPCAYVNVIGKLVIHTQFGDRTSHLRFPRQSALGKPSVRA